MKMKENFVVSGTDHEKSIPNDVSDTYKFHSDIMKMKENFVEADGYREKSIPNDVSNTDVFINFYCFLINFS